MGVDIIPAINSSEVSQLFLARLDLADLPPLLISAQCPPHPTILASSLCITTAAAILQLFLYISSRLLCFAAIFFPRLGWPARPKPVPNDPPGIPPARWSALPYPRKPLQRSTVKTTRQWNTGELHWPAGKTGGQLTMFGPTLSPIQGTGWSACLGRTPHTDSR